VREAALASGGAREAGRPTIRPGSLPLFAESSVVGAAALFVIFLLLPLLALLWRSWTAGSLWKGIHEPVVVHALALTVTTTAMTVALSIAFGTPLAFLLARRRFPGRQIVDALVTLPLVLPPLVAGVALLMAFGRRGLLGDQLGALGVEVPFTTGAVVLAELFVAGPFFVRSAKVGFEAVSRAMEDAAAISGAGTWETFRYVTLPLAMPSMVSGGVLCAARAFSEFGATLMFAGNLEGRTQTMSLAIESAMQTDLGAALALSLVLVIIAAVALAIPLVLVRNTTVM